MKRHFMASIRCILISVVLLAQEIAPVYAAQTELLEDDSEICYETLSEDDLCEEIEEEQTDLVEEEPFCEIANEPETTEDFDESVDTYTDLYEDFSSSEGVMGTAVYVDEAGNLVISTEAVRESEEYSDEQIIEAVIEELDTYSDGEMSLADSAEPLVTLSYNVSFSQSDARKMLKKVNSLRTNPSTAWQKTQSGGKEYLSGLSELSYDYELEKAAMLRAAEVAISFSHTRPNNESCFTSYSDCFTYSSCGENIAAGYTTADAVFNGWSETNESYSGQGHRRNMLGRNYTVIGIGHVIMNGTHYWTQEFSSVNSGLAETPAASGSQKVTTTVSRNRMSGYSLSLNPKSGTATEGDTYNLPKVECSFSVQDGWPSKKTFKSVMSTEWTVADDNDSAYVTVNNEDKTVLLSEDSALSKESRVINLKTVSGSTAKTFALTVKCKHNMTNTIVPATLYSEGSQGGVCSKCGYSNTVTIPQIKSIELSKSSAYYDGTDKTPTVTVKDSKKKVVSLDHYTVQVFDDTGETVYPGAGCIYPGNYRVRVTFKKSDSESGYEALYSGSKVLKYTVLPKPLTSSDMSVSIAQNNVYIGKRVEPKVTIIDKTVGAELVEDTDYIVEYSNNTNVGKAQITVLGIGNYLGSLNKTVYINSAKFTTSDVVISGAGGTEYTGAEVAEDGSCLGYSYTGSMIKPKVSVSIEPEGCDPYQLIEGTDFTVSYGKDNKNVNMTSKKAPTITVTGKGNFKSSGKIIYSFTIQGENLQTCKADKVYTEYSKKTQKPVPSVYSKTGTALKAKTDYAVSGYCKMHEGDEDKDAGSINPSDYDLSTESILPKDSGDYVIILSGKGGYAGTNLAVPMTVAPQGTKSMSKLSYSLPKLTYPKLQPDDDKVVVKSGKIILNGFLYNLGEAEKVLSVNEQTEKALLAYQNAISTAEGESDDEELARLNSMNYVYFCRDNYGVGKATAVFAAIPGHGYTGSTQKTYQILGISMSKLKLVNFVGSMVYDGTLRKQNFGSIEDAKVTYLKYAPKKATPVILQYNPLSPDESDYTVSYSYAKGTNAGKVNVVITGNPKKGYTGTIKKTFKVTPKKLSLSDIKSADTRIRINGQVPFTGLETVAYTGAAALVRPVIEYAPYDFSDAMKLRCGEDYTISYSNNIKRAASTDKKSPTVNIKAKGNYSGTLKLTFNISSEESEKSLFVNVGADKKSVGDGSLANPFRTIQAALDIANAGDTIYLRAGTYKGSVVFDKDRSGDSENGDITITSFPGEKVTLTGIAKSDEPIIYMKEGTHHITIKGLRIGGYSSLWAYGALLEVTGECNDGQNKGIHHVTFEDNEFYKLKTTNASKNGGGANAILLSGAGDSLTDDSRAIHDIKISGNSVHDNVNGWSENISVTGNCYDVIIEGNTVYNNTNIGIDLYGNNDDEEYCQNSEYNHPRDCVISGNVVYKCKCKYAECAGIYVDGAYGQSWEDGIKILNNEVYNNQYGIEIGSEEWRDYYDTGSGTDANGYNHHVRFVEVSGNNIHNNPCGGVRIGGYSDAPQNPESEEQMTGIVSDCKIINNYFTNNGSGSNGYNGEIHFSKCILDSIDVSGNIIVQGRSNKKYPQFEYEEELVIR